MSSGAAPVSRGICLSVGCLPVMKRSISTLRAGMRSENLRQQLLPFRVAGVGDGPDDCHLVLGRHGKHLGDQVFRALGVGLDDARHEAHVDAGGLHVAEEAERAHGLDHGRHLVGLGLRAIAVDPAQDTAPPRRTRLFLGGAASDAGALSSASTSTKARAIAERMTSPVHISRAHLLRRDEGAGVADLWRRRASRRNHQRARGLGPKQRTGEFTMRRFMLAALPRRGAGGGLRQRHGSARHRDAARRRVRRHAHAYDPGYYTDPPRPRVYGYYARVPL